RSCVSSASLGADGSSRVLSKAGALLFQTTVPKPWSARFSARLLPITPAPRTAICALGAFGSAMVLSSFEFRRGFGIQVPRSQARQTRGLFQRAPFLHRALHCPGLGLTRNKHEECPRFLERGRRQGQPPRR